MSRWEEWASCAVFIGAVWFAYLVSRPDLWDTWLAIPMFIGVWLTFAFCGVLAARWFGGGRKGRRCRYDGELLRRANPRFYWPSERRQTIEWRRMTQKRSGDCPYCGGRYVDHGKPKCSHCGAPKRGG